jgi:hypothetical protein
MSSCPTPTLSHLEERARRLWHVFGRRWIACPPLRVNIKGGRLHCGPQCPQPEHLIRHQHARWGGWRPCPPVQGWQSHHQAWPILQCQLGLLLLPTAKHGAWGRGSVRVNDTLSHFTRGSNTITELGHSFSTNSVYSPSTHHNRGGEPRWNTD